MEEKLNKLVKSIKEKLKGIFGEEKLILDNINKEDSLLFFGYMIGFYDCKTIFKIQDEEILKTDLEWILNFR